jgi:hypothetical protein
MVTGCRWIARAGRLATDASNGVRCSGRQARRGGGEATVAVNSSVVAARSRERSRALTLMRRLV